MSIEFIGHYGNKFYPGDVPCECCGASVSDVGVFMQNNVRVSCIPPGYSSAMWQQVPHKGIVLSGYKGEGDLPKQDVIDEINLGDGETLYIRSALEEYPYEE